MRTRAVTRFEVVEVAQGSAIRRVGDLHRSRAAATEVACELDKADGWVPFAGKVSRWAVRPVTK